MKNIDDISGDELTARIRQFLSLYENRPIQQNIGGLQCEGSFLLWYVLRELDVEEIVECGVWEGQSSWLIEQARPDCLLVHSDPLFEHGFDFLRYKTKNGIYTSVDFLAMANEHVSLFPRSGSKTLAFFDDHMDVLPRLEECIRLGIQHILLDDNWHSLSDHLTLWLYQNIPLSGRTKQRVDAVIPHIAEQCEFPLIDNPIFSRQARQQNMTYLRLEVKNQ